LQNPRGLHELAVEADLVFADIGGTRPLGALLELLPRLLERCAPRIVVIKCREMHAAVAAAAQRAGGTGSWPEVLAHLQRTEAAAAAAAAKAAAVAAAAAAAAAAAVAAAMAAAAPSQTATVPASDLEASAEGVVASAAAPQAAPPLATAVADTATANVETALHAAFRLYPLKHKPRTAPSGEQICGFHNFGVCRNDVCAFDHEHWGHCHLITATAAAQGTLRCDAQRPCRTWGASPCRTYHREGA